MSIIEIVVKSIEGFRVGCFMFRSKISNIGQKGDEGSECDGRPLGVMMVSTDTLVYGSSRCGAGQSYMDKA